MGLLISGAATESRSLALEPVELSSTDSTCPTQLSSPPDHCSLHLILGQNVFPHFPQCSYLLFRFAAEWWHMGTTLDLAQCALRLGYLCTGPYEDSQMCLMAHLWPYTLVVSQHARLCLGWLKPIQCAVKIGRNWSKKGFQVLTRAKDQNSDLNETVFPDLKVRLTWRQGFF